MNSYLISYDLIGPSRDYESIIEKIKTYPKWARPLESVWVIKSDKTAVEIRDEIHSVMDINDKLLVTQLTKTAAWMNLGPKISEWLKTNL